MARAIFHMHQTSSACADVCACNRTHQMEKTVYDVLLMFNCSGHHSFLCFTYPQGFFQAFFTTVTQWYYSGIQSFKTDSSIFYHFTNLYSIVIVEVLFLIHYPLEKHFKEGYNFSVF